jgi:hypothetical protein
MRGRIPGREAERRGWGMISGLASLLVALSIHIANIESERLRE